MRILFIGAVEFSYRSLEKLLEMGTEVVGVCTLQHSKINSDHVDLTSLAQDTEIPVRYTPDINADDTLSWMQGLKPDVIFCFGWSRLLRKKLLELAPLGVIGYHPTALPANRGRHPLIWALVLGLKETASTFFFMDEGADSGDIVSQQQFEILAGDDARSLYQRMTEVALQQIEEFVPQLENGSYERLPQNHMLANVWRKRESLDGQIDWRMPAEGIYNLVRGLTKPYIGAHFIFRGKNIKVWHTEVVICSEHNNVEPGKILQVDKGGIVVKTGVDAIRLKGIEPSINVMPGDYL